MKKNIITKLAAVLILATIALPGCDLCNFTSAQLTGFFQDLSSVGVGAIFDVISDRGNPTGDANLQAVIDVAQDATQDCVDNRIDDAIQDDPRS